MKLEKATRRDRKYQKRNNGMQVDNANIRILEQQKKERSEKIKREREEKEKNTDEMFVTD